MAVNPVPLYKEPDGQGEYIKQGSLRGGQIPGNAGMEDHVTPSLTFYVTVLITIKGFLNLLSATE